jgi:ligand-binding SRPBCC domain-containing protein
MASFKIQRTMKAPLKKVWDAADFTKSVGISKVEVRDDGDPEKNNVGFTRAVTSGNRTVIERLLSVDPMKCYTYTLCEGAPVKEDYLGIVEFTQEGDATKISWSTNFTPKIPGTGWISALVIKSVVKKIIDSIEAEVLTSSIEI